ncbi:MFS transporter [Desulfospira joergensenii]|uniref:MFS transporter n=1 Tax=Desulfospira joergensenii TaxID=53329 RepID=UPI0003B64B79|nr:MFS transporter [Desulfospira joergensenii]
MGTAEKSSDLSPFSIPNIRLFIAFRVFFNSRFYYPVFTVLFLDFGLTLAQFSILNAVWAATIVLAEVPSGALADIMGRKRLLVFAASIMVVEVGIISFVPRSHVSIVFWVFLVNRILSGLAEAAASGADEAIAYDSLAAEGDPEQWGRILEILMRFQSVGFIISMALGAAVYDPALVDRVCSFLGADLGITQAITMRFPLYLTFALALLALAATLKMKDPGTGKDSARSREMKPAQAFGLTLAAGLWILKTPFAMTVILFGMLFDGLIRVVITLSSQYYRVIDLPESLFGIMGSMVALLGLVIPKIARKIAENRPPSHALWITAGLAATGLLTMNLFWPYAGVIPALITFSAMYFTGFFVSFYLNRAASSDQRATVLSFKGLSYNISYGLLGLLYAVLLKTGKQGMQGPGLEDRVFMDTFAWFPGTFAAGFLLCLALFFIWLRKAGPEI